MEKKECCPICGKKELERIENNTNCPWLKSDTREWWGCLNCGNSFFKNIEEKKG